MTHESLFKLKTARHLCLASAFERSAGGRPLSFRRSSSKSGAQDLKDLPSCESSSCRYFEVEARMSGNGISNDLFFPIFSGNQSDQGLNPSMGNQG